MVSNAPISKAIPTLALDIKIETMQINITTAMFSMRLTEINLCAFHKSYNLKPFEEISIELSLNSIFASDTMIAISNSNTNTQRELIKLINFTRKL